MKRYFPWVVVVLLLVVGLVVGVILYGDRTEEEVVWKEYVSDDEVFAIQFPQQPVDDSYTEEVDGTGVEIKYDTYTVKQEDEEREYLVYVVEYPPLVDIQKYPLRTLESSIGGAVASREGNKLIFSEPTDVQGYTAARYMLSNEDLGYYIHGLGVVVDNKQYIIMAQLETDDEEEFDTFASSFRLN